MNRAFFALLTYLFFACSLEAQSANINCATAFTIPDPIEWCSGVTEFNTTNAGGSEYTADGCFAGTQNDVWFKFIAFAKAVNIVINAEVGGSLKSPKVVLYNGDCGSEVFNLGCEASVSGSNIVNIFKGGLTLGDTYYIRVGGNANNQGSFQICMNNYNPPVEPGQDFGTSSKLCDKSSFIVQVLSGGGNDPDEAEGTCLDIFGDSENQSSWITWLAENNGTLSFSINPLNPTDDIDFVLFELPNGINDQTGKFALRCMASSCPGPTGLKDASTDIEEDLGCEANEDGFVKSLTLVAGKAYGLLINNFSESGVGFELEFSGDAEFQGPDPKFSLKIDSDIDTTSGLTCDKLFEAIDESDGGLGSIVKYEWNFGDGASPQTGDGPGPHTVSYESFGEKYVVLTVTSDLGCIVTAVEQVFAAPCCKDVESIAIIPERIKASQCEGDSFGSIQVSGNGGFPDYLYSFEDRPFQRSSFFPNLRAGDYKIKIIDIKGCETEEVFTVEVASPLFVDAGEDSSVEYLGDEIQLDGDFTSSEDVTIQWEPSDNVKCDDGTTNCTQPVAVPAGTTTYTMIVTDENGCSKTDQVTIEVLNTRPVFGPNIFSPNQDGFNDVFTLVGNSASVILIKELLIFDRWGNKVYSGFNLLPNDSNNGWDGNFNSSPALQGVYTWIAKIEYLDTLDPKGDVETGEVTLVR